MVRDEAVMPERLRQGYGLTALTIAFANTSVMFFLAKYLVDDAGLAAWLAGAVVLVGKAWDAVSDPLMGWISDRTVHPMGPRRVWMARGLLPFMALFALLWVPVPLAGWAQAAWYALLLVAYNTAFTMVVVPYGSLTPALAPTYHLRTRLNASRMAWSFAGGIFAGVSMPVLYQATGSWVVGASLLAGLGILPGLATLWATRGADVSAPVASPLSAVFSVLAVPDFRRTAALFLVAWSTIATLSALLPFYMKHVLGRADLMDPMFAALQISALCAMPLVSWLSGRLQKHRAYAVTLSVWAVILVGMAFLPATAGAWVLLLGVLCGPGLAASHLLPWSMLPDVVEADRLARGEERAGAFYGMMTFLEKVGTAVSIQVLLLSLSLVGYVSGAETQSELVRTAIRLLVGPAPGVVLAAACVYAWRMPAVKSAETV